MPFISVAQTEEECPGELRPWHVGGLESGTAKVIAKLNMLHPNWRQRGSHDADGVGGGGQDDDEDDKEEEMHDDWPVVVDADVRAWAERIYNSASENEGRRQPEESLRTIVAQCREEIDQEGAAAAAKM